MKNKILLVDCESNGTNVCAIEDGVLQEYYTETDEETQITGNIYKGRVTDVVDGLQSAFVDIGLERTGFWYIGETLMHNTILGEQNALPQTISAKEGDFVMVQAVKESTPLKGAKLTSNVSIPGHYLIYLHNLEFIGVSNKILDPDERARLAGILTGLAPEGRGFIARTNSMNVSEEEILSEARSLIEAGKLLQEKWENTGEIALIHNEGNLLYRTIRDMLSSETEKIVCNSPEMADSIRAMVKSICPYFTGDVEVYSKTEDVFDYYNVGDDIEALGNRRVELSIGGFLIIEKTEALTAIDVNTGRFTGTKNREDTIYRTNVEAAREIARQIRLRNIGGLIVVDFIDMLEEAHKESVVEVLKEELFKDRVKTKVMNMSGLGLVEISRKKIGKEISIVSSEKCSYCGGTGRIASFHVLARLLKLSLKKRFADNPSENVLCVRMQSDFAEYVLSRKEFSKECETEWKDKRVYLVLSGDVPHGTFEIEEYNLDQMQNSLLLQ